MLDIALSAPHDLNVFRDAARGLIAAGVAPRDVIWHEGEADGLFSTPYLPTGEALSVPKAYVALAEDVICHADPARLPLLYETLWRISQGERMLLAVAADPAVHRLMRMQKNVRREIHKMHAFVRFRCVETEEGERYIAWFEPEHHMLERAAPFFVGRFSAMHWSILTPIGSLHWDTSTLVRGPAVAKSEAPAGDDFEDWWRTYYRATFNPARVNPTMQRAEMAKRYWKNLPEAADIPSLIANAARRESDMLAAAPQAPRKIIPAPRPPVAAPADATPLAAIAAEAASCRRCPLHAFATQTVFGAGPFDARIMMVGEQPGDQEDLQGKPFVGPAGQLLDRAMEEAGIEREKVYVTNAVKHFKFEPRGKRRIHRNPDRPEIEACRFWLERELAFVKPELVVVLGGSAGRAIYGRTVKVMSERGTLSDDPRGFRRLLTVHPSMILRIPGESEKSKAFADLVRDLRKAA